MKKKKDKPAEKEKPKYEPPILESENIFETRALACGKCRRGPERKTACSVLSAES